MIKKQLKVLTTVTIVLAFVTLGLLYFIKDNNSNNIIEPRLLVDRDLFDVIEIKVDNVKDSFIIVQENGGFRMEGLSSEIINPEYLQQIVADSAYIEYIQEIEEPSDLSYYGLDDPYSTVTISYKDNANVTLRIGNEGPIDNTHYVLVEATNKVYLFNKVSIIRYIMSKEEYVNFIIVPPHEIQNVLTTIQYVRYQGKKISRPIIIEIVDSNNDDQVLIASSFGVASHLMIEPTLQKIDLREATEQFAALVGLLNYGIVTYDATPDQLEQYGFNDADLVIDFLFSPDGQREATEYLLEVTMIDNNAYVMVNKNGVIHKIQEEAFLSVAYENMISRWFITPLMLDVESLTIRIDNKSHTFTIERLGNNNINVLMDNQEIDDGEFRKFYNLVVSASHDGIYGPFSPSIQSKLEIEFNYIDEGKPNDIVRYYKGETRRNNVCFNDTCEFAIKETYIEFIKTAVEALKNGDAFQTNWE